MVQTRLKHGAKSDGESKPDLEARVVVLEIVAMTSLALALDTSENGGVEQARGISSLIMETIDQRCRELGLDDLSSHGARSYANELLSTALLSLYPDKN